MISQCANASPSMLPPVVVRLANSLANGKQAFISWAPIRSKKILSKQRWITHCRPQAPSINQGKKIYQCKKSEEHLKNSKTSRSASSMFTSIVYIATAQFISWDCSFNYEMALRCFLLLFTKFYLMQLSYAKHWWAYGDVLFAYLGWFACYILSPYSSLMRKGY